MQEQSRKARLLVADDERDAVVLLKAILDSADYEILVAHDGIEGYQSYVKHQPDIVLLDLQMPGQSGIEVCKAIKEREGLNFLPVVLVTCIEDPFVKLEGLQAGADDYITKPYFCEELRLKISSLLKIKRSTDRLKQALDESESREIALTKRLYELGK